MKRKSKYRQFAPVIAAALTICAAGQIISAETLDSVKDSQDTATESKTLSSVQEDGVYNIDCEGSILAESEVKDSEIYLLSLDVLALPAETQKAFAQSFAQAYNDFVNSKEGDICQLTKSFEAHLLMNGVAGESEQILKKYITRLRRWIISRWPNMNLRGNFLHFARCMAAVIAKFVECMGSQSLNIDNLDALEARAAQCFSSAIQYAEQNSHCRL